MCLPLGPIRRPRYRSPRPVYSAESIAREFVGKTTPLGDGSRYRIDDASGVSVVMTVRVKDGTYEGFSYERFKAARKLKVRSDDYLVFRNYLRSL